MNEYRMIEAAEAEDIRQRFLAVDTANVADVLDTMGLHDQGLAADFKPFPATAGRLAGWAYTIRCQMTSFPMGGDAEKMQACKGIGPGGVSVWSGDGEGICYFGELIAIGMKERGAVGALVDGGIRDVRWIGELGFPVYARYRTPLQSIGRWKVNAWEVPVLLRGATARTVKVAPGDLVLGDDDGTIVVPRPVVREVLVEAERLTATKVEIRRQLKAGLTLDEALERFGHV